MVVYPLCESNIYVIAPGAMISCNSSLKEKFNAQFPGCNLLEVREFLFKIWLLVIIDRVWRIIDLLFLFFLADARVFLTIHYVTQVESTHPFWGTSGISSNGCLDASSSASNAAAYLPILYADEKGNDAFWGNYFSWITVRKILTISLTCKNSLFSSPYFPDNATVSWFY